MERYVVIPSGPLEGTEFRVANQPYSGLLCDEIDSDRWPTIVITGPTQSGKSLCGFVGPTLWKAHELEQEVVLGIPDGDMADDKWRRDFEKVLKKSPAIEWLLPTSGPGSRNGTVRDKVVLGNGVMLKVMTQGGKDTSKAGFTTRNVHVTEAAGWSHTAEKSKEGKPLDQVAGRMRAIKWRDRRLIVEGTVTTSDELPWTLKGEDADLPLSTESRIVTPCPHCREWIAPEREHLKGWQEARSVIEAAEQVTWVCPACGHAISDGERRDSNQECQLLHRGQSIVNGEIIGDPPATDTLWFRWSQWHNCLLDAADAARDEWLAAQLPEGTEDREDKDKVLAQQVWAIPFKSQLADADPLKPELLRRRTDSWERNVLPPDTTHLTIGVDCGKWTGWWLALAGRSNGVVHVPAYGAFDVCTTDADEVESRLFAALSDVLDATFEAGFLQAAEVAAAEQRRLADSVWIDRGWMKDVVCDVVRARGTMRDNRYRAAKGFGKTARSKTPYYAPQKRTKERPWIGNRWYAEFDVTDRIVKFNFDADYYKLRVQEWLRTKAGVKGSLTFFRPDSPNEHAKVTHHFCAEQFRREWVPLKGFVDRWIKKGANHWLDCAAEAAAALDYVGYRIADAPDAEPQPAQKKPAAKPQGNWYAAALAKIA